jgi:hypothetical protein
MAPMTDDAAPTESLIPYDVWAEEALREVAIRALELVAESGLPGEHHFYLTFRTDHPGTSLPAHLKARYPEEITVVLQYQFEDLQVDRKAGCFRVTLFFGGVPARLTVPFGALTMFHDPHARFGLRFPASIAPAAEGTKAEAKTEAPAVPAAPDAAASAQVVSLHAFRRKLGQEA